MQRNIFNFTIKKQFMSKHTKRYEKLLKSKGLTTIKTTEKVVELDNGSQFKLTNEQILTFALLADDYPVNYDYIYLVDGRLTRSDIKSTVSSLKRDIISLGKTANEVRVADKELYAKYKTAFEHEQRSCFNIPTI